MRDLVNGHLRQQAGGSAGNRWHGSNIHGEMECDMSQALLAVQLLFYLLGGLGLFFMGIGALWFVDIYKKMNEQ